MEFDEIVVKESPGLCRCCLSEGCYKDLGSEYTWMNETEVYADMLLECFDISITQHNEGPNGPNRLICEVCITRLRDACNFKKQVLDSEKKFINMIGRGEFRPKMLIYKTQMKSEEITMEEPPDELEAEYLEDDVDFGDNVNDSEEIRDDSLPTVSEITVASLPVKLKRGRPKKTVKSEKKSKIAKMEEKPKTSKAVAKGSQREPSKKSDNYLRKNNLLILFNNTTLIPFKWLGKYMCFYCDEYLTDYDRYREHTLTHSVSSVKDRSFRFVKAADAEVKIDISYNECSICSEPFSCLDDTINHLIIEHGLPYDLEAPLKLTPYRLEAIQCIICDEIFESFRKLVIHMNSIHPTGCFSCKECGMTFNKKKNVTTHMRNRHKEEYRCRKCGETFASYISLRSHRYRGHPSTCNICLQTFPSVLKRLNHMKNDHQSSEFKCGFCQLVLPSNHAMIIHINRCTAKKEPEFYDAVVESGDDDDERKIATKDLRTSIATILNMSTALPFKYFLSKFRCFYCSKDFPSCDRLKDHTVMDHPHCEATDKCLKLRNRYNGNKIKIDISSLSCKLCFESFNELNVLIDHLITVHKEQCHRSVNVILQPFKLMKHIYPCPICQEEYRYFNLLLKHISKAHSGNKFICIHCGAPFRTDPNLRAHVKRYHQIHVDKYECTHCKLFFGTHSKLRHHLGSAHDLKTFNCTECTETFTSKYWLQRHMVSEHGEGHKCPYCGKYFVMHSHMILHSRRVHLKERNAKCSICSESFFDRQRLKMHMVKHIGIRNFECDICSKTFLWKKNLRAHIASHVRNSMPPTIP